MNERKTGTAHASREREKRNFTGSKSSREVSGLHQTKIPPIGNRIRSGTSPRLISGVSDLLPQVDFSLQALRSEGRDIQTVVVENGIDQLELVIVEQLGNGVTDQTALLQAAHVRLKRQSLVAPPKVQPRHVKLDSRTHPCGALGRRTPGRLSGLELQSKPVGEGIAFRLLNLHQDILLWIGSFGVLHRGIDLAEDAEIVEPGLCTQEILLAEGFSFMNLQFPLQHIVARMFGPGHHDPVHGEALSFLKRVSDVFTIRPAGRRLGRNLQHGIGKSVIEVIAEDSFPVVCQILLGIRLARLRA